MKSPPTSHVVRALRRRRGRLERALEVTTLCERKMSLCPTLSAAASNSRLNFVESAAARKSLLGNGGDGNGMLLLYGYGDGSSNRFTDRCLATKTRALYNRSMRKIKYAVGLHDYCRTCAYIYPPSCEN